LIGGAVALAVLALCGVGFHHSGIHHGHSHHSLGKAHARIGPSVHRTAHQTTSHNGSANRSPGASVFELITWLSPVYICGAIIGFGATGTLISPLIQGWFRLGTALLGAYLVCAFCIRPVLAGIQNWASLPAKTLDDAILENGTAVTDFDSQGYGLVRLNLDGQVIQLLGQLVPEERSGTRVRSGETLFVRSVDSTKQRCVVCRTGGSVLVRN
jgi:hypothetical protein